MAAVDVVDFETAKTAISMTGSGAQHGERLQTLLTAVSRRVDAITGPVLTRSVTQTQSSMPTRSLFNLTEWVSWGAFPNMAVQTVTALTEYQSGTGTALTGETLTTSGDYVVIDGLLARRSGFYTTSWSGPFSVTYTAGRFASISTVDPLFAEAVSEIIARVWPQYAAAWSRGGVDFTAAEEGIGFYRSVDPVIKELLAHERRPPAVA